MMDKVQGEHTNAIDGDFTPNEALALMLAGTSLEIMQDFAVKGFVVGRRASSVQRDVAERDMNLQPKTKKVKNRTTNIVALMLGLFGANSTSVNAQLAAPATGTTSDQTSSATVGPTADQEEPTVLSPFVVDTSADKGSYRANSTLGGTRVRTDLNDIASSISVVTAQFLQDTNATNNESLLIYTMNTQVGGLQGNFAGNVAGGTTFTEPLENPASTNTRVRGLTTADNTRNYFLTDIPWDSFDVNRIDIQRGPNSILFGVGSPGGIINANTNDAAFVNSNNVTDRVGSYGSLRNTADFNYVLLKNELAIRVGWVNDNEHYQQEPAYNLTTRYYGAIRFDPVIFGKHNHTSFRANIEKGNVTSNNPRTIPPGDTITPWFEDGKPSFNQWATTGINGQPFTGDDATSLYAGKLFGEAVGDHGVTLGANEVFSFFNGSNAGNGIPTTQSALPTYVINGSSGRYMYPIPSVEGQTVGPPLFNAIDGLPSYSFYQVPDFNSYALYSNVPAIAKAASYYSDKVLTNSSIFNFYDHLLDGVNKKEWQGWTAYDLNLSQTFFDDRLAFELVYDSQHHTQGQTQLITGNAYEINVDVNQTYSNGSPNPDVGRPYVGSGNGGTSGSETIDRGSLRLTGVYELRSDDFLNRNSLLAKILGRSVFTGLLDEDQRKELDLTWYNYATTPDYAFEAGDPAAAAQLTLVRQPGWIAYIGPNLLGSNSQNGLNLSNISVPISPTKSTTVQMFNPTWNAPNVNPSAPYSYISYGNASLQSGSDQQFNNPANYIGWTTEPVQWLSATNPADFPQLITSATKAHYVDISQGITWQGYLFEGDLVPTLAYRKDSVVNYDTASPANFQTGSVSEDFNQDPKSRSQANGISKAWGGVYHIPKRLTSWLPWATNLSLFYDRDENFKADAPRTNLEGNQVANPLGHTKEYGLTLSTLNDKLSLKIAHYSTRVDNATLDVTSGNSLAGLGSNSAGIWDLPTWGMFFAAQYQDYFEGKAPANDQTSNYAEGDGVPNSSGGPGTPAFDNSPEVRGTPGFHGQSGVPGGGFYPEQDVINAWLNIPVPANFFTYYGIHPIGINPALMAATGQIRSAFVGPGFDDTTGQFNTYVESAGPVSPVSTESEVSTGMEWELSAQLMRNWNFTLNFSTTKAVRSNIDPATVQFITTMTQFFDGPAGQVRFNWAGGPAAGPLWNANIYAPYLTEQAQVGQTAPDLPKWNINIVTTYDFDRGPLKGVIVGGAFRDEGRRILGYQYNQTLNSGNGGLDITEPWYGPTDAHVDLWLGYQHRVYANKVNWRIQLNLTNVGEATHLVPAQYEPDGSLALARIENGMEWALTNSFDF
jgi:hypothetical protein